jgi:hypothetical protein
MKVSVHEIGQSGSHVVVIDDFLEPAQAVVEAAAQLAPFPPETGTAYPGLRRQIGPNDAISGYVLHALQSLSPVLRDYFQAAYFAVTEASFSLVTTRPEALRGVQRVPHIDNDDPSLIAILHHLHDIPGTGTAFYRHIASGMERPDPAHPGHLRSLLQAEATRTEGQGFADASTEAFEQIFYVEGRFNRLVMYQGCLLHSGIIPPGFTFSDDPRRGRLTANMFVQITGKTGKGAA